MQDNKSIEKLKQCFTDSFFSTEVNSLQQLQKENSPRTKNIFRMSSRFSDEPKAYLAKVKARKNQAKSQCLQALHSNIRAKCELQRVERDASVCRYEFTKLYYNKKFKLMENSLMTEFKLDNEYMFRQSVDKFRGQKLFNQLSFNLRIEKQRRHQEELCQKKRQSQKIFRQTLKSTDEKIKKIISNNYDKIRQQKADFQQTKEKLQDLATTKSKFNYMSKVNQEMKVILDYNKKLQQMSEVIDPQDPFEPKQLPRILLNYQKNI